MREMKDSGVPWIGEIPRDWTTKQLKYCADSAQENSFIDGDWIESPYIEETGIRYLTTGNIGDGTFKRQGDGHISLESFTALNCKYAYPGDLAIARLNAPYGRSCILPEDNDCYVLAVDIVIVRPREDSRFLCYITQCAGYQKKVEDAARGTTMLRISRTNLGKIKVPLPNIEEQCRIADFLDAKCAEIDSILEKTRASIEEYKKLKQSVITEAVTKGIHGDRQMKDSGIEWIEAIPAEWAVLPLKQLFSFGKGLSITKDNLVEEGHPVISYGQIHSKQNSGVSVNDALIRFIAEKDTSEPSLVYPGDFAFADTSEDLDGCGNCVYNSSSIAFYGGYHTIVLHSKDSGDHKYLAYLFKTDPWRLQIRSRLTEVKLFSVSQKVLKKSTILLPSLAEQKEIAAYLDEKCAAIDSLIASKEALITELEAYKKSIIYEYVTGKKEVL